MEVRSGFLKSENRMTDVINRESPSTKPRKSSKRRKIANTIPKQPSRTSARIASTSIRPAYNGNDKPIRIVILKQDSLKGKSSKGFTPPASAKRTTKALEDIQTRWTSWKTTTNLLARDEFGTFHFDDTLDVLANKSLAEVLDEGRFGGTCFPPTTPLT